MYTSHQADGNPVPAEDARRKVRVHVSRTQPITGGLPLWHFLPGDPESGAPLARGVTSATVHAPRQEQATTWFESVNPQFDVVEYYGDDYAPPAPAPPAEDARPEDLRLRAAWALSNHREEEAAADKAVAAECERQARDVLSAAFLAHLGLHVPADDAAILTSGPDEDGEFDAYYTADGLTFTARNKGGEPHLYLVWTCPACDTESRQLVSDFVSLGGAVERRDNLACGRVSCPTCDARRRRERTPTPDEALGNAIAEYVRERITDTLDHRLEQLDERVGNLVDRTNGRA